MSIISIEEMREYFQKFTCEILTSNENNKEMIKNFASKKANNQLEAYITNEDKAWAEDTDGETRVYLIKDESGEIALFFSIKCGLLVGENPKYKLNEEEREFVSCIVDALKENDEDAIKSYYEAGDSLFKERVDVLFEIANRRIDVKKETKATDQVESWRVEKCVSAIELRHLCKNENYRLPEDLKIPLGFGVFWEVIVPKLLEITETVGCKLLFRTLNDASFFTLNSAVSV